MFKHKLKNIVFDIECFRWRWNLSLLVFQSLQIGKLGLKIRKKLEIVWSFRIEIHLYFHDRLPPQFGKAYLYSSYLASYVYEGRKGLVQPPFSQRYSRKTFCARPA